MGDLHTYRIVKKSEFVLFFLLSLGTFFFSSAIFAQEPDVSGSTQVEKPSSDSKVVSEERDPVEYRQLLMKEIGDSMKELTRMAKGKKPYDAARVAQLGSAMEKNFSKLTSLFEGGVALGKSRAKSEIWIEKSSFDQLMQAAEVASGAVAGSQDKKSLKAGLQSLGRNCALCHKHYRGTKFYLP